MTHNEGYAVYAPLNLRQKYGHLGDVSQRILDDYIVVFDEKRITKLTKKYDELVQKLNEDQKMTLENYEDQAMGSERYTYRIGCTLVRLIEEKYGMPEVQEAIYLNASDFIKKYDHLLSYYRF